MDLCHFLWFINRRSLYFANISEFDDRWEGALPAGTVEGSKRYFQSVIAAYGKVMGVYTSDEKMDSDTIQGFMRAMKSSQDGYGISCWHENAVESVAMWKLYTRGKDGVAIQTTVGRLKQCLAREPRNIYIAAVKYLDHGTLPREKFISIDQILPIAVKRRSFEHESEVRLILARRQEEVADEPSLARSGEGISVHIPALIERIVASPEYPPWAIANLQELVTAAGIGVTVELSDLLREPDTPEMPEPSVRKSVE